MEKMLLFGGLLLMMYFQTGSSYKLVCYYNINANQRPESAKFTPENIDPYLCTHIILLQATLNDNKIMLETSGDDVVYKQLNDLKKQNTKLLTLLGVGGSNMVLSRFTEMVSSAGTRKIFINSMIDFLRVYGFDGIGLFFVYPGIGDSPPQDKQRFTKLCEETLAAFEAEASATSRPRLLVTAIVAGMINIVEKGYELSSISKALDFINVLAGFNGLSKSVGHNSPLCQGPELVGEEVYYNIKNMLNYFKEKGALPEKLLVGFLTNGQTFNYSKKQCGEKVTDSAAQPIARNGINPYYEVCTMIKDAVVKWSPDQKVPYACKENLWIGYEDRQSYQCKVKFLKDNGFGGAALWTLENDDFTGNFCGQGKYPLTTHLKALMEGKLSGRATEAYQEVPDEDSKDYHRVKQAILTRYALTPDAYRRRFRELNKQEKDSHAEWAGQGQQVQHLCSQVPTL
ncbi:chitinase-like protein 4 [Discoglossus pictus]